jgi:hypothetical protein
MLGILEIEPIVEQRFSKIAVEIDRVQRRRRRRFDLLDSVVSLSSKRYPKWWQWRGADAEGYRHDAQNGEHSGRKRAAAANLFVSAWHARVMCRTLARSASQDPPEIPLGDRLAAAGRAQSLLELIEEGVTEAFALLFVPARRFAGVGYSSRPSARRCSPEKPIMF